MLTTAERSRARAATASTMRAASRLEREGLVCRKVYAEVPPRVEYSISSHGQTTKPLIEAVRAWGHTHLDRVAERTTPPPARSRA